MKTSDILSEQDFLPQQGQIASQLGRQFWEVAKEEAFKRGRAGDQDFIHKTATSLVQRFRTSVMKAIDEQLKFTQMKEVR